MICKTKFLSEQDIFSIVREVGLDKLMSDLIDRIRISFLDYHPDKMQIPNRDGFNYLQPQPGLLEWMPLLEVGSRMLIKLVGYHPRNPNVNSLPTILSHFSLYNATTGQLEAILDGTFLTALRTGAASAISSRLLADPKSSTIGMIGCGAQAVTQLHAMSLVFDIENVLFYDIDEITNQSFRDRCPFLGEAVRFQKTDMSEIVSTADVLCVATSIDVGAGPVFGDASTKDHLHINAVGSDFPDKTELPKALLERATVVPDFLAQALKEGECQQLSEDQVGDELFKMLRCGDSEKLRSTTTVFDSTGWALEDYIVTNLFLEHAVRLGIGTEIQTDYTGVDPKSPYQFLTLAESEKE